MLDGSRVSVNDHQAGVVPGLYRMLRDLFHW